MDAEQARHVEAALQRWGIPGVVAPEEPGDPAGGWRVYDEADPATRREVTADVLASVIARLSAEERPAAGPTRGFVLPSQDE